MRRSYFLNIFFNKTDLINDMLCTNYALIIVMLILFIIIFSKDIFGFQQSDFC